MRSVEEPLWKEEGSWQERADAMDGVVISHRTWDLVNDCLTEVVSTRLIVWSLMAIAVVEDERFSSDIKASALRSLCTGQ